MGEVSVILELGFGWFCVIFALRSSCSGLVSFTGTGLGRTASQSNDANATWMRMKDEDPRVGDETVS